MADYRIICVNTEHPHRHITHVGTGTSTASYTKRWTVGEVHAAMTRGDTFHTVSPSTGRRANVKADNCQVKGCSIQTLRSVSDAIADNNLDNLSSCSV
jgi:hypothetical protein